MAGDHTLSSLWDTAADLQLCRTPPVQRPLVAAVHPAPCTPAVRSSNAHCHQHCHMLLHLPHCLLLQDPSAIQAAHSSAPLPEEFNAMAFLSAKGKGKPVAGVCARTYRLSTCCCVRQSSAVSNWQQHRHTQQPGSQLCVPDRRSACLCMCWFKGKRLSAACGRVPAVEAWGAIASVLVNTQRSGHLTWSAYMLCASSAERPLCCVSTNRQLMKHHDTPNVAHPVGVPRIPVYTTCTHTHS